jgi:hypothetical protein
MAWAVWPGIAAPLVTTVCVFSLAIAFMLHDVTVVIASRKVIKIEGIFS